MELHGIKVLKEKVSCAKGKFTSSPIIRGLPVGKVNPKETVWFLNQVHVGHGS